MRLNCIFFLLILKQFNNFSLLWLNEFEQFHPCLNVPWLLFPPHPVFFFFFLCISINASSSPQVLFSDSWLRIHDQVSCTTTGWKVSTGAWGHHQWSYNWRQWFSSSLNLSVASGSAVGVRVLWVSSPPMGDCWQAHSCSDPERYVQLLWVYDCHECVMPRRWISQFSFPAFTYPFGFSQECSQSFRKCGVNVLFRVEHSSISICRTL